MDFTYTPIRLQGDSLNMEYFVVPWDTEIIGQAVAEIKHLEVKDPSRARLDYLEFEKWCRAQEIVLCSCRVSHEQLIESFFLQEQGFRFVELNYLPEFHGLQSQHFSSSSIEIEVAHEKDRDGLSQMAGEIFHHGRFHQDTSLGKEIGNKRYKTWLLNAFSRSSQTVYKCLLDGEIVAFLVVEYRSQKCCHWSLTGLAPGKAGQGLGTQVWKAMMHFHQNEGMESIGTSISSHNTAIFNLYVKLGFRFPIPNVSFHWRP